MEQTQAKFEGWAIVELMGHQREVGFVTTQYFGDKAMFQIDSPELPDRDYTLKRPEWGIRTTSGEHTDAPKGSTVRRPGIPAKTRIVNPAAIYALNPCTEETAKKAMDDESPRGLILLSVPDEKPAELTAGDPMQPECDCGAGECCAVCDPEYPI